MTFSLPSTLPRLPLLSLPSLPPSPNALTLTLAFPNRNPRVSRKMLLPPKSLSLQQLSALQDSVLDLVQTSPPTWISAIASNLIIFVVGSPLLFSGLSALGFGAAFLLGVLTWRAFGAAGFLLVATYFIIVSPWNSFCYIW